MIKHVKYLICILLFCSCKTQKETIVKSNDCFEYIIANEFSYAPLGKISYSKTQLTEELFKDVVREESVMVSKGQANVYYLKFYQGRNKYVFIKQYKEDKYRLFNAELLDNNIPVTPIKGSDKIHLNMSKKNFMKRFSIEGKQVCDTLRVDDEDGNSGHWFYFKEGVLYKIRLQTVNVN